MRNIFRFAYLSAVWLQFGQNSIDIIIENNFALDLAFYCNQTDDKLCIIETDLSFLQIFLI